MIHRIDRVNPDVDDRVIKPNEARIAVNLRFGASTDDTNLSGGTLILGNKKIDSFAPPAGTNKVVGVYADLESRNVFFAMYNSEGNHGLYRINGATNVVQTIAIGSWLNFQPEDTYNVSITGIDGKLYWTDGINSPRVINVQKGIDTILQTPNADVYPVTVEDWFYTQIKRPPGQPLEISPMLGLEDTSITFNNQTLTNTGLQYSYYYVYDNFEESRLAPFTYNSYAVYNVTLRIPNDEYNNYTSQSSLIKKVVVVVRNGNDGTWRELVYQDNLSPQQSWTFTNILTQFKNAVASDITDARFDSVPLVSKTNEIAQNKINHANYRIDYEYDNNISIETSIRPIATIISEGTGFPVNDSTYVFNSFLPWGRYTIGVELVDKYGRTFPVINAKEVVAPVLQQQYENRSLTTYQPGNRIQLGTGNSLFDITVFNYDQTANYNTVAEYKITGELPQWVERVNVVRSKAKNIVTMHQSIGQMFMWYENEQQVTKLFNWVYPQLTQYNIPVNGRTSDTNVIYNANETDKQYTFKGFIIKFFDAAPFVQTDNLYLTIYPLYNVGSVNSANPYGPERLNDAGVYAQTVKFKVSKIDGNLIYIKQGDEIQKHPNYPDIYNTKDLQLTPWSFNVAVFDGTVNSVTAAQNPNKWYPLLWNFTLTQEQNLDDQIVYTTQDSFTRQDYEEKLANDGYVQGWLKGDGSIARVKKTMPSATSNSTSLYVFPQVNSGGAELPIIVEKDIRIASFEWRGNFISMSPRDIYAQEWNQNIGQLNTVNYKDARNRVLPSNICFSGNIIQGTQVNGLNKFNSLDFRQAPAENGPITSLVTTNATQREPGVLLAIGTFGISSFYYDAIQLTNVDGSNNVTTTDAYLASQRPLVGQYGTSRPMSVTKTPLGTVYWWSDVVNDLIRYSNAGLERLGNTFSFSNYLRKKYNDNPLLITWYDQVTDEINLLGRFQNTAVFSERYKTFQGERQYWKAGPTGPLYPQRAIGLPTKQYWFINGEIYVADVEANRVETPSNFIFDAFKNPSVQVVTNEAPSAVKRWNQVKVFGHRPVEVNLRAPIDNGGELVSSILPEYFINRKGDWEAAIRRAENTTGGLLAGKLMESRIIYSNFAFSAEGFEKLNFIEVKSNVSIVQ